MTYQNTYSAIGTVRPKLTLLGEALSEALVRARMPVITTYDLFNHMRRLYKSGRRLWLRKPLPEHEDLDRMRKQLDAAGVLTPDRDFKRGVYRVVALGDRPAEEICGIVEPACYLSHISAMARYGLTHRRALALHLTAPDVQTTQALWEKVFERDYDPEERERLADTQIVRPAPRIHFPREVRGQPLVFSRTSHPGDSQPIRGTTARIATIGEVFAGMLEDPKPCGGMSHVVEVWREHAKVYLDEIVETIEKRPKGIIKVRAGYLLDELLGIKDPRVERWIQFAQRGSSRLLDPSAPFESQYSEKWMLSLNVA